MQGLEWIVIFYTNYISLKIDSKSCYLYLEPSSPSIFETQDNDTTKNTVAKRINVTQQLIIMNAKFNSLNKVYLPIIST